MSEQTDSIRTDRSSGLKQPTKSPGNRIEMITTDGTKDFRECEHNVTNARLQTVARIMLEAKKVGPTIDKVMRTLNVSRGHAYRLMKNARVNGFLERMQDALNEKKIKAVSDAIDRTERAMGLWDRRMAEIEKEDAVTPDALADSFRIFEKASELTGIREDHKTKAESEKDRGKQGGDFNLVQLFGEETLKKAMDVKRRTTPTDV